MHRFTPAACLLILAPAGFAQTSDVSDHAKHAWAENIGWLNFRDAGDPVASQGVRLEASYLSGFVWAENVGWINLGDGSPADGFHYANTDSSDFGVNLDPNTGELSGLAWGENIGWINFAGGAMATPAKPARLDFASRRLLGYAWAENTGWINLDHDEHFVGFGCPADFNSDGSVNTLDVIAFLNAWAAQDGSADMNSDGQIDTRDVLVFLNAWTSGC